MPLPAASVITWLTDLGWDARQEFGAPILPGPYVPDEPDRMVIVTAVPGPGFVLEGDGDAGAFQARVRGGQNDQADAEALAYLLDKLILGASFPAVTPSGQVIIHVHRLGGTPSPLTAGPDTGDRYEYTTTYLCIAGT
jgi:hypothetical protein